MLRVDVARQVGALPLAASFELQGAGIVALFGRSGSGKTSIVNMVAGLLRPQRGRISLDDAVLFDAEAGIHEPPERRRMGYVFQDARLFPHLNVAANLHYGLKRATDRAVGLDAIVDLLKLGPLMQRRTHRLSGGERQRVAIGRALLSQPKMLLLDEPLAALDAERREEVLPFLESLRDKLALPMLYVSHDFEEVRRLATHLVLLEGGRVSAQGTVAQMSLHGGVRAIVGPDSIGAVLEGTVVALDADNLTRIRIAHSQWLVASQPLAPGSGVRVQIMARDIIVATEEPRGLSVRNVLKGIIREILHDDAGSDLVFIDLGGATIVARVSKQASRELLLRPSLEVWALIKSVALRGQVSPRT